MTKESERQSSGSEVVIRSEDLQEKGHPKGNALSLLQTNDLKSAKVPELFGFKIAQGKEYKITEKSPINA
jgi:hypothetical protein